MDDDKICLFLDTINDKILCMIDEAKNCLERPTLACKASIFERVSYSKEKVNNRKRHMSIVSLQSNWMNNIGMYQSENAPR